MRAWIHQRHGWKGRNSGRSLCEYQLDAERRKGNGMKGEGMGWGVYQRSGHTGCTPSQLYKLKVASQYFPQSAVFIAPPRHHSQHSPFKLSHSRILCLLCASSPRIISLTHHQKSFSCFPRQRMPLIRPQHPQHHIVHHGRKDITSLRFAVESPSSVFIHGIGHIPYKLCSPWRRDGEVGNNHSEDEGGSKQRWSAYGTGPVARGRLEVLEVCVSVVRCTREGFGSGEGGEGLRVWAVST